MWSSVIWICSGTKRLRNTFKHQPNKSRRAFPSVQTTLDLLNGGRGGGGGGGDGGWGVEEDENEGKGGVGGGNFCRTGPCTDFPPIFFLEFLNFFPRQICRSDVYYWGELVIYEPGGREVEMARIKRKRKRNPATDRWDVKLKQMKKNFHVLACARPWRLEANERLFFQRQGKCSAFSSTQTHTRN